MLAKGRGLRLVQYSWEPTAGNCVQASKHVGYQTIMLSKVLNEAISITAWKIHLQYRGDWGKFEHRKCASIGWLGITERPVTRQRFSDTNDRSWPAVAGDSGAVERELPTRSCYSRPAASRQ